MQSGGLESMIAPFIFFFLRWKLNYVQFKKMLLRIARSFVFHRGKSLCLGKETGSTNVEGPLHVRLNLLTQSLAGIDSAGPTTKESF